MCPIAAAIFTTASSAGDILAKPSTFALITSVTMSGSGIWVRFVDPRKTLPSDTMTAWRFRSLWATSSAKRGFPLLRV